MMTTLDPVFSDAVRDELAAIGTKRSLLQRHQRRVRIAAAAVIAVAVAGVTTGAAVVVSAYPGSTTVAPLGAAVTVTRTGTSTIDLGANSDNANTVIIDVTCVSRTGSIQVPTTSGFSVDASGTPSIDQTTTQWDCAQRSATVHIKDGYLAPGGTSITVTADAGTTWTAVARYGSASTQPFAVNAHGQTYGEPNGVYGNPDLQGAQATNGKIGYIYTKAFSSFRGCGYLPVYDSDGTTVIGEFSIGIDPVTGVMDSECDSNGSPAPVPSPADSSTPAG
jgi:hypothetical protein